MGMRALRISPDPARDLQDQLRAPVPRVRIRQAGHYVP